MGSDTFWVLSRKIMAKYNICGVAIWETLAIIMNESGNEYPSLEACNKLEHWLDDATEMFEWMQANNKYCFDPVWGCRKRNNCKPKIKPEGK